MYITLCCLDEGQVVEKAKWLKAKHIVLQHFYAGDPQANGRRDFLVRALTIPKEWFEEALALRCIIQQNPVQYIAHLNSFDPEIAGQVLDEVMLPNLFFMDKQQASQALKLLDDLGDNAGPLGSALLDLIAIARDVHWKSIEEVKPQLPQLHEHCDQIELK